MVSAKKVERLRGDRGLVGKTGIARERERETADGKRSHREHKTILIQRRIVAAAAKVAWVDGARSIVE